MSSRLALLPTGFVEVDAIVTSLPVMALFYVLQRYLVGGLTAGSVKG